MLSGYSSFAFLQVNLSVVVSTLSYPLFVLVPRPAFLRNSSPLLVPTEVGRLLSIIEWAQVENCALDGENGTCLRFLKSFDKRESP
jgi:hypothetical protein